MHKNLKNPKKIGRRNAPKTEDPAVQIQKLQEAYIRDMTAIKNEERKINSADPEEIARVKKHDDGVKMSIMEAEKIWMNVKIFQIQYPEIFAKYTFEEKTNLVSTNFEAFFKAFPIVSKFMAVHLQYDRKAFRKYLLKFDTIKPNENKNDPANKSKWIEREAYYVQYLWEAKQPGRINRKEAQQVWQNAYTSIKKEEEDFQNMYKSSEKAIKQKDAKYKSELLVEAVQRIESAEQVPDSPELLLKQYNMLVDRLYKQRYDNFVKILPDHVSKIPASCQGEGQDQELGAEYESALHQAKTLKKYKKANMEGFRHST
jgi:hypothetical protein